MRYTAPDGTTRYAGPWKGRVSDVEDLPEVGGQKRFRVRCIIPDVLGETESNWCQPCLAPNTSGTPELGVQVWLIFEQHDAEKPVWFGYAPSAETGALAAAPTQLGVDDETTALLIGKGGGATEVDDPDSDSGIRRILEPVTTAQPRYPHVQGIRVGQNYVEVDGTVGQERINIYHKSGAYMELGPTGQLHIVSRGTENHWSKGTRTDVVTGTETKVRGGRVQEDYKQTVVARYRRGIEETIDGGLTRSMKGSKSETIGGSRTAAVDGLDKRQAGAVEDASLGGRSIATLGNHEEIVTGSVSKTIQNKDFTQGQINAYEVAVNLGDLNFTTATGKFKVATPLGTFEVRETGEAVLSNAAGAEIKITAAGRISLSGTTDEFLSLVDELLSLLLSTTVSTAIGLQPLSTALPSPAASPLGLLQQRLQAIKG